MVHFYVKSQYEKLMQKCFFCADGTWFFFCWSNICKRAIFMSSVSCIKQILLGEKWWGKIRMFTFLLMLFWSCCFFSSDFSKGEHKNGRSTVLFNSAWNGFSFFQLFYCIRAYREKGARQFYMLLYSIALRTFSLLPALMFSVSVRLIPSSCIRRWGECVRKMGWVG